MTTAAELLVAISGLSGVSAGEMLLAAESPPPSSVTITVVNTQELEFVHGEDLVLLEDDTPLTLIPPPTSKLNINTKKSTTVTEVGNEITLREY